MNRSAFSQIISASQTPLKSSRFYAPAKILLFKVRPDSSLCFDFSLPVDTYQLEDVVLSEDNQEVEENQKIDPVASVLRPSAGIFQLVHEVESDKEDSGDEGDDDEAEDEEDVDDVEEEKDEVDQALDFSWTKVAPKQVEMPDLVQEEELEKHSFTAPTVVSVEVLQEKDDGQGQFIFGAPHNESTISEKESEGEAEQGISGADAAMKVVDEKAESTEDEGDDASEKEAGAEVLKRTRMSSRRTSTSPLGRSTSKLRSNSSPLTPKRSLSETAPAQTPPPSSSRRSARAASASTTVTPSRRSTRKTSGASPATTPTRVAKEESQNAAAPASPSNTTERSKRKSLSSPRVSSPTTPSKSSKARSMSSPLAASSSRKSARGKVAEPVEQVVDVGVKNDEKQEVPLERAATLPMEVEAAEAVAADLEEREGSAASTVIMESSSRASAASTEVMEEDLVREASAIPMETSITRFP